jgi:hypothetical protein
MINKLNSFVMFGSKSPTNPSGGGEKMNKKMLIPLLMLVMLTLPLLGTVQGYQFRKNKNATFEATIQLWPDLASFESPDFEMEVNADGDLIMKNFRLVGLL